MLVNIAEAQPGDIVKVGIDDAQLETEGALRTEIASAIPAARYGGPRVRIDTEMGPLFLSQVKPKTYPRKGGNVTYHTYPVTTREDARSLFSIIVEKSAHNDLKTPNTTKVRLHFYKVTDTYRTGSQWRAFLQWLVPRTNIQLFYFVRIDFFANLVEEVGESHGTTVLPRNCLEVTALKNREEGRAWCKRKSGRKQDYNTYQAAEARGYTPGELLEDWDSYDDEDDNELSYAVTVQRKEATCKKPRLQSLVRKATGRNVRNVTHGSLLQAAACDFDPYNQFMKYRFRLYPSADGWKHRRAEAYYRANVETIGMQPAYNYAAREGVLKEWFVREAYYERLGPEICDFLRSYLKS